MKKTGYGSLFATNLEEEIEQIRAAESRSPKTPVAASKNNKLLIAFLAFACVGVVAGMIGMAVLFSNLRTPAAYPQVESTQPDSTQRRRPVISGKRSPAARQPAAAPPVIKRPQRTYNGSPAAVN